MARAAYQITTDDYLFAREYITRQMRTAPNGYPSLDPDTAGWAARSMKAEREYSETQDAKRLQSWCDTYLTAEEWGRLKNAIRDQRRRLRERLGKKESLVSTKLTREAWLILTTLSEREGMTVSEWVIANHRDQWLGPG